MHKLKQLSASSFLRLLFAAFTFAFFCSAFIAPDRAEMFTGLRRIMTESSKVSTNYFDNGGYAGTFLNAGLVCLVLTALYSLPKVKVNATSCLAFLLTAGFCFWGVNILNLWFGFLGVLLYCLVKRENPANQINANDAIHGVLMFRPLPKHLKADQNEICNRLDPKKDVDCMTDLSNAGVFEGRSDLGFAPCTPAACMEILDYYGIDCKGKNAVVIGRSLVVGKPAAMMLMGKNATVTVCHTKTVNTAEICRKADILVSAAGVLNSLTKDYVRPGQVVIDVSINWDENKPNARGGLGAIAGDAVYAEVEPIVEAITPVPGGVGSVTTSVLMKHVIEAAERV